MITKQQYMDMAAGVIAEYPKAALAYQVQDPRLMAQLNAIATMLSMASSEQDVAAMEQWTMSRDMTVLANAAVKGVLPFGSPTIVSLTVQNITATPFAVTSGRRLLDPQGRIYVVTTGATVLANGTATVTAIQRTESLLEHTVTANQAFYRIPVPSPDIGYISEIRLADSLGNTFTQTPEFTNIETGERVFHLESDENRLLSVVFGAANIGGYQPAVGEVMEVTTLVTEGDITLAAGTGFVFEYATTVAESGAKVNLAAVLAPGSAPMDIDTLRELTSYPSLYDKSAVYLGNFDYLVRSQLAPFTFLSVWNEAREEKVRGPNLDNINTLFVAAVKDGTDNATLFAQIVQLIANADDSYRVKQVPVIERQIQTDIIINAQTVYDYEAVRQQVIELVLGEYGHDSTWAKRGGGRVRNKRLYKLLEGIQALQDGNSDMSVLVTDPDSDIMPEHFRYISEASLNVVVEPEN